MNHTLLAQASSDDGIGTGAIVAIIGIYLLIFLIAVAGMWKMFEKAGEPGWKAIIPIYNTYIMIKIAGRPGWWLLLMLVPLVNIVIWVLVANDLSKSFGKGTGFTIGLIFLSIIFVCILGFGSARYLGPGGRSGGMGGGSIPPPPDQNSPWPAPS